MDLFHSILIKASSLEKRKHYTVRDVQNSKIYSNYCCCVSPNVFDYNKKRFGIKNKPIYHVDDSDCDYTSNLCNLPIEDIDNCKIEKNDLDKLFNEYFSTYKDDEDIKMYKKWSDELSNLEIKDRLLFLAFEGCGAYLLKKDKNKYLIDLSYMNQFQVRKDFVKYGAKLYISENKDDVSIEINNKIITSFDNGWQTAYNVFVSSLITHVTIAEHALYTHFYIAGNMASIMYMIDNNMKGELCEFIKPFVYKTPYVNNNAVEILISKRGIVNRIFAFEVDELERYYKYLITNNMLFVFDIEKISKDTKLYHDAKIYYDVVKDFVSQSIELFIDDRNINLFLDNVKNIIPELMPENNDNNDNIRNKLKKILSDFIFTVTFWHEYVGNMSWYILNPVFMKSKVFRSDSGAIYGNKQTYLQSVFLAVLTSSIKMPRITDNFGDFYIGKKQDIWNKFRENLLKIKFQSKYMDVKYLETSVSL
jgi:hypothetical protein